MKLSFKYDFKRKDLLYGGIITAIIAVIALVLILIGLSTEVFDPIGRAIDEFSISDSFFFSKTKRHSDCADLNPGIVLIDIADCDSRQEIADIVCKINDASPKLLAVDIIFGEYSSSSSFSDSLLVRAFQSSRNLVLAERFVNGENGWYSERSFFADDIPCIEGDVNFQYGIVRTFEDEYVAGMAHIPSFVSLIASQAGICNGFKKQLINYSPVNTITIPADYTGSFDIVRDQIVILGDAGDLRDYHDIPVLINGQSRTSGLRIIAQCLYTLQPGNGFVTCPNWLALVIGIVLTYLFCAFIASPMFRVDRFNGLWTSIWQVIVLLLLVALTYLLFWGFHFCMPLKYWLIGVGFSNLATDFFYFVKPKSF